MFSKWRYLGGISTQNTMYHNNTRTIISPSYPVYALVHIADVKSIGVTPANSQLHLITSICPVHKVHNGPPLLACSSPGRLFKIAYLLPWSVPTWPLILCKTSLACLLFSGYRPIHTHQYLSRLFDKTVHKIWSMVWLQKMYLAPYAVQITYMTFFVI